MHLKARKGEVSVTVRDGVDALMSRSKHTIPHAQSSPCVNLSIGARARQVQDGQEGVEPKTGNRKIERDIKGCETRVREIVVRNLRHLFHLKVFLLSNPSYFCYFLFDTEDTEAKCRPDSERLQLSFPAFLLFSVNMVKLLQHFVLRMNSRLTFIIFWHRSSVMAVWYWQWTEYGNICTPILCVLHGCDFHNPFLLILQHEFWTVAHSRNREICVCVWRTVDTNELW